MAALQFNASERTEQFDETTQVHHLQTMVREPLPNLDDDLAHLLTLVRAKGEESHMDALGGLLNYIALLEKKAKVVGSAASSTDLMLLNPVTLTLVE